MKLYFFSDLVNILKLKVELTSLKANINFYATPDIVNLNQFELFKNEKKKIFRWIKNVTYSYDNHNIHGLDASHSIIQ